ncbi:TPA: hypothetical protein N2A32_002769 [Pseudomonas aeruginosa]|uniref:hypothetical protein n=1 Tax=Pseudomonas aeruginosa TaxID=287 RepID=UPI0031367416|nr:hypothetical protein [Pseudomonas aeruginosa]HDR2994383.1 hypothetical protein [Pseudomonas aeruginosa]HDR3056422.1 hypothetical protein [Pseudomonas aeruginosa]HDR3062539.1 hypothetical protein [Pseudomonas aeruginosa]HDR3084618.1 hypothetical protein [Pseudomonas aeruginosa]
MSSTQHQLIEQCATRLRGIVEALDNIHDTSPHRWSTDLDDVHSSAESLLDLIKDQAPTQAAQGLAGAALAQPSQAQAEQAEGAHVPDEVFAGVFAEWWEEEGQYCRAGGGDYERTFAFQAWRHLYPLLLQARAALAQPSPVRSSLLINGYQLRAALDFIAPDGTAEQLESEACIEWRQQDADFLEAGLYAFCAEYPEEGGILLDEEPTTAQPSPLQSEQAEAERPEVVAYRTIGRHTKHQHPHYALNYYKQNAEDQAAHWRERGCEVSEDELMTVAQHERIVGALRAENAKLSEALDRWPLIRDSLKLRLADALARVAELEGKLTDWVHEGFRLNEALAVAKAQHSVPDDDMILQIFADNAEHSEQGDEHGYCIVREQHAQAIARKLLAAAPGNSAQHSVPEGLALIPVRETEAMHDAVMALLYKGVARTDTQKLLDAYIAAAPGKAQHSVPDHAELLQALERTHAGHMVGHDQSDQPKGGYSDGYVNGFGECIKVARKVLAAAPSHSTPVPQAWIDVLAERRRQVEAEGWTPEHDDEHADGQMAQAAGCYALHAGGIGTDWPDGRQNGAALFWPWDKDSWKPTTPRRDLVKACALALAEIERLDRAGISQSPQPGATTASS